MQIKAYILILFLSCCCIAQKLVFYSTSGDREFAQVKLSPIGFNPRSGQLDGKLIIANPFDGCSPIGNIENDQQEEDDFFLFVNDLNCLQSIKAKNILKSGALAGIIRQNTTTTWHDRQINIVHIPILQLQGQKFDQIINDIKSNKSSNPLIASILFGKQEQMTDIEIELWMSPTEMEIYSFVLNMEKFLNNEKNEVTFSPRYAMHSQKDRKSFIGCYSNGMYCPGEIQYDGRIQGQNIISQSLRQIIIRSISPSKWWSYIKHYYIQCLRNPQSDVFMDSRKLSICTRNSMMLAQIDYNYVEKQMQQSFMGMRKQVDDNIWLREQRQDYIREKVTQYPVMLINKKQFTQFDMTQTRMTICKMQHNRSDQCSEILDGKLHSSQWFIILGIILVIVVFILIAYKYIMYRRMQKQMKGQVTSTLEQYYRYMETLDGDAAPQPKLYFNKPDSVNNIKSQQQKNAHEQQSTPEIQIQMTNTNKNSQQQPKEGHQILVQEENN